MFSTVLDDLAIGSPVYHNSFVRVIIFYVHFTYGKSEWIGNKIKTVVDQAVKVITKRTVSISKEMYHNSFVRVILVAGKSESIGTK
jgi:hypothetical protein